MVSFFRLPESKLLVAYSHKWSWINFSCVESSRGAVG